jgi:hypothetical protein
LNAALSFSARAIHQLESLKPSDSLKAGLQLQSSCKREFPQPSA